MCFGTNDQNDDDDDDDGKWQWRENKKLAIKENVFVYRFSIICMHCSMWH